MRTVEIKVYRFDELSDEAKEKARAWWRQSSEGDQYWFESIFDDFESICKILGIRLDGYKTGQKSIFFSGFCSQGDGASWAGHYSHEKNAGKNIRKYAPKDETLHAIADRLTAIQRPYFYGLRAKVSQSGRYSHEMTMGIDWTETENGREVKREDEDELLDAFRDLARWLYQTLEREYDWQNADAQVDELIRANEYEFNEDGSRF